MSATDRLAPALRGKFLALLTGSLLLSGLVAAHPGAPPSRPQGIV